MTGKLTIVGTGPGNPDQTTPEAVNAIAASHVFFGYGPYLDRLTLRDDQRRVASDNREELARAKDALMTAASGEQVCVVSGGDPGVFAMAAAVCEAIEDGPPAWRELELSIVPGVTAMLAVAALYNPISKARPWQLGSAFSILREVLPWTTPVIFGRAAGRPDEAISVVSLADADPAKADMATCVVIGSPETRVIERPNQAPLVYSPRSLGAPK